MGKHGMHSLQARERVVGQTCEDSEEHRRACCPEDPLAEKIGGSLSEVGFSSQHFLFLTTHISAGTEYLRLSMHSVNPEEASNWPLLTLR